MTRNRMSISVPRSLGELNVIDVSANVPAGSHREIHPSTANAEFAPPRRCQASGVGVGISRVATRHRRASDERVRAITATSTRFYRTVIDRGGRCGSRNRRHRDQTWHREPRVTLSRRRPPSYSGAAALLKNLTDSQLPNFWFIESFTNIAEYEYFRLKTEFRTRK